MKNYSLTVATIGLLFFASITAHADSSSSAKIPGKSHPGVADANAPFTPEFVRPVSIPGEFMPDHKLIPSLGIVHVYFPSFHDIAAMQDVPAFTDSIGMPELSVASRDVSQAADVNEFHSSGLGGSFLGTDLSISRTSATPLPEIKKITLNNKLVASIGRDPATLTGSRGENELTGDLSIGTEKIPERTPVADIASMFLMGTGLVGLAGLSRRKKKR